MNLEIFFHDDNISNYDIHYTCGYNYYYCMLLRSAFIGSNYPKSTDFSNNHILSNSTA